MKVVIFFTLLIPLVRALDMQEFTNIGNRKPVDHIIDSRITNGKVANAHQFPYQVGMPLSDGKVQYFCGGALISHDYVLSAAHCIIDVENVTILLGSNSRLTPAENITVDKSHLVPHPNFDPKSMQNDIGLIRIPRIEYNAAIQPVALPNAASAKTNYIDRDVVASGWGITSDKSTPPVLLQYANFKIISNKLCAKTFGKDVLYPGTICANAPNKVSTCYGDSGGPLVLTSPKTLIGITSYGAIVGCERGYPQVYTRVDHYRDWIKGVTGLSFE